MTRRAICVDPVQSSNICGGGIAVYQPERGICQESGTAGISDFTRRPKLGATPLGQLLAFIAFRNRSGRSHPQATYRTRFSQAPVSSDQ